jgi:hypothetical protein
MTIKQRDVDATILVSLAEMVRVRLVEQVGIEDYDAILLVRNNKWPGA